MKMIFGIPIFSVLFFTLVCTHGPAGLFEEPFPGEGRLFVADNGHKSVRVFDIPHLGEVLDTEVPHSTMLMGYTPDKQFVATTRGRDVVDQFITIFATGVGIYPWEHEGVSDEEIQQAHLHRPFIAKTIPNQQIGRSLQGFAGTSGSGPFAVQEEWKRYLLWAEDVAEMYLLEMEESFYPDREFKIKRTIDLITPGHYHVISAGEYVWVGYTSGYIRQFDKNGNKLQEYFPYFGTHGVFYDKVADVAGYGLSNGKTMIIPDASSSGGGTISFVSSANNDRFASYITGANGVYFGYTDGSTSVNRLDGIRAGGNITATDVPLNGTLVFKHTPTDCDGYFLVITENGMLTVHDGVTGAQIVNLQVTTLIIGYDENVDQARKSDIVTYGKYFVVSVPGRGHLVHGVWHPDHNPRVIETRVIGGTPTRLAALMLPSYDSQC